LLADHFPKLQKIPPLSWIDSRIEVRSSSIHGKGIFATAPIQQGEVVIIWGGTLFTLEDIHAGKAAEHSYAAIHEGVFLGHTCEQGNSADDFMNHSCDPNIWMVNEITWAARRNINTGEEVTCDCAMYWGPDEDEPAEWECHCDSALCRKVFTTQDWQRTELHERYGCHFAPYINEHISQLHEINKGELS
jgi:SET domain-containing protein